MEKSISKNKVSYIDKLSVEPRARYRRKLELINGFDPYDCKKNLWISDPKVLPATTYFDIVNYLVDGVSYYTSQQFKSYKSLEAYKQFCDGWVHDLLIFKPGDCNNMVVKARVPGSAEHNSSKDQGTRLCLYLSLKAQSWSDARATCYDKNSALLSLDSIISVEDKLLHSYLLVKGINDIWTGMHKDGGRQMWDEPGKGMVKAFNGFQYAVEQAKRGWRWDTSSFTDITPTCGVFSHVAKIRRRRDIDTFTKPSRDTSNRDDLLAKDSKGSSEKNQESFKRFLSDQGMKQFAEKMNDSPKDKTGNGNSGNSTKESKLSDDDDSNHEVMKRFTPIVKLISTDSPIASNNDNDTDIVDVSNNDTNTETIDAPNYVSLSKNNSDHTSINTSLATSNQSDISATNASSVSNQSDMSTTNTSSVSNQSDMSTTNTSSVSNQSDMSTTNTSSVSDISTTNTSSVSNQSDMSTTNTSSVSDISTTNTSSVSNQSDTTTSSSSNETDIGTNTHISPNMTSNMSSGQFSSNPSFMTFLKRDSGKSDTDDKMDINLETSTEQLNKQIESETPKQLFRSLQKNSVNETQSRKKSAMTSISLSSKNEIRTGQLTSRKLSDNTGISTTAEIITGIHSSLENFTSTIENTTRVPNSLEQFKNYTYAPNSLAEFTSTVKTTTQVPGENTTLLNLSEQDAVVRKRLSGITVSTVPLQNVTESSFSNNVTVLSSREDKAESSSSEHSTTPGNASKKLENEVSETNNASETSEFPWELLFTSSDGLQVGSTFTSETGNSPDSNEELFKDQSSTATVTDTDNSAPENTTSSIITQKTQHTHSTTMSESIAHEPTMIDVHAREQTPSESEVSLTNNRRRIESLEQLTSPRTLFRGQTSTAVRMEEGSQRHESALAQDSLVHISDTTSATSNGQGWMTLRDCQQQHQFVCVARPVQDFIPVDKCESGWLGHDLVSRCYHVVNQKVTLAEAQANCGREGAKVAATDTTFYSSVIAELLERLALRQEFAGNLVWVEAGSGGQKGWCMAMETRAKDVRQAACDTKLPYLCEKPSSPPDTAPAERINSGDSMLDKQPLMMNRSSWNPQTLKCPLPMSNHGDLIVWYKDGQPITSDSKNADVITLQGFIKIHDVTVTEAVFFNQMADDNGLPAIIGRGLQQMSDSIYPNMHFSHPYLTDIIIQPQLANAETDEVEFLAYLCLSMETMAPQDKGVVVETYLQNLYAELVASEDSLRHEWNLSLPVKQAFRLLMTEMCPETLLTDNKTGLQATFPSIPVNQISVSVETCETNSENKKEWVAGGTSVGYAQCSGNLRSGALWSYWQVEKKACPDNDDDQLTTTGTPKIAINTNNAAVSVTHSFPIHWTASRLTDRLTQILNTSRDLTDGQVRTAADIIDSVVAFPRLSEDDGMTLIRTVNRMMDIPLQTLRAAQQSTQASTRILQNLDKFGAKLDLGKNSHVRYVTPNVAMEVWNMDQSGEPVIGLAATVGVNKDALLSQARIVTLSNRTWTNLHLAQFDVAIELPDQLVSRDSSGKGPLTMVIYRKASLFLSCQKSDASIIDSDSHWPEVKSAIISATLSFQPLINLQEKVKLIFKPLKFAGNRLTRCVYWDFSIPGGGGWSSMGCEFNGTLQGRDICLCDHLTNFAILLDYYGDSNPVGEVHDTALSVLTIIGLGLSILGLALTVLTFIFFQKLRQGRAQLTLFNMSMALLCSEVVLLVGLKQTNNYSVCLVVAILLHYFILVSFLWMLIEAVLQYLIFVKVLGTYIVNYNLKTVLPAWGLPVIPVIAVLATDYRQYRGRKDYCWMNLDAFYYAFALPVGIIILFNLVTFVVIMFSLLRRPQGLRSTKTKGHKAETNIKAAFTIFILLGLTWIFGYLAIADARLSFQYLFTIFSSLQGFLIFVLLVARRRQFREQWQLLCCNQARLVRGLRATPTLSNSTSSQSSGSSFTSSSRLRSSSDSSSKTIHSLIRCTNNSISNCQIQPRDSETQSC